MICNEYTLVKYNSCNKLYRRNRMSCCKKLTLHSFVKKRQKVQLKDFNSTDLFFKYLGQVEARDFD